MNTGSQIRIKIGTMELFGTVDRVYHMGVVGAEYTQDCPDVYWDIEFTISDRKKNGVSYNDTNRGTYGRWKQSTDGGTVAYFIDSPKGITFNLTELEACYLIAAIYAVAPSGGGSHEFTLKRKLDDQFAQQFNDETYKNNVVETLLQRFSTQVINDYKESLES